MRLISYAPGMNTNMSPHADASATRSHSAAATSHIASFSKFTAFGRYSIRTGKLLPCDTNTSDGAR